MNGFELERELSARDPSRPPIIFISALNENELSNAVRRAYRCSFLQKPFTVDVLIELVRPHLTRVVGCENQTEGRLAKSSWQSTHG
jgi:DNA-binding response OmpR family regulator